MKNIDKSREMIPKYNRLFLCIDFMQINFKPEQKVLLLVISSKIINRDINKTHNNYYQQFLNIYNLV